MQFGPISFKMELMERFLGDKINRSGNIHGTEFRNFKITNQDAGTCTSLENDLGMFSVIKKRTKDHCNSTLMNC